MKAHLRANAITTPQSGRQRSEKDVRMLRPQIDRLATASPPRSWAIVLPSSTNLGPVNHQRFDRDHNCVRISSQPSFVDPHNNEDNDENAFSWYLPCYIKYAPPNRSSNATARRGVRVTNTLGQADRRKGHIYVDPQGTWSPNRALGIIRCITSGLLLANSDSEEPYRLSSHKVGMQGLCNDHSVLLL